MKPVGWALMMGALVLTMSSALAQMAGGYGGGYGNNGGAYGGYGGGMTYVARVNAAPGYYGGGIRFVTIPAPTQIPGQMARSFFTGAGVNLGGTNVMGQAVMTPGYGRYLGQRQQRAPAVAVRPRPRGGNVVAMSP